MIFGGNYFSFFSFLDIDCKIFAFCSKSFNMSETFSAIWPKIFDRHVKRAFDASIQTHWNLLNDIEKDSEANRKKIEKFKYFRNMRKNLGSTVFRQKCWNCNLCVHLNNLKHSEFKTFANFFGTRSKKLFGLRKTLLALIFKNCIFFRMRMFWKTYCV